MFSAKTTSHLLRLNITLETLINRANGRQINRMEWKEQNF